MPAPRFAQVRETTLNAPLLNDATEFVLKDLVDVYGNELDPTDDFQDSVYFVFNPGGSREEIVYATGFTVNLDGSVTVDTGVARGRAAKYPYGAGGTAYDHPSGTIVVVSNVPQIYKSLIDYADSLAIAGAPDADDTTKGLSEQATQAEIDAGTATGGTGARLFVNPQRLAASIYATRLPSADQKTFLNGVPGMILPYGGNSAPTGFLACDGSAVALATYATLGGILLGRYGYGTATTFTVNAGTDIVTSNAHGLSNAQPLLLTSTTTLPAGLSANTIYYVISATTNTFQLSTSVGGSAVDITDTGTGTHSWYSQFKVPNLGSSMLVGKGQKTRTMVFDGATAVDPATDRITVTANDWLFTGQAVALTGSSLPTGLSAQTYYVVRVSSTVIQLATSVSNANNGIVVDITVDGSGDCTLTQVLTSRAVGDEGGIETQTTVPVHDHPVTGTYESGGSGSGGTGGGDESAIDVQDRGETAPNNMPPYVGVNFIIKT